MQKKSGIFQSIINYKYKICVPFFSKPEFSKHVFSKLGAMGDWLGLGLGLSFEKSYF